MLNHAKQIQISSIAVNSFTPILNDNLTINLTTNEQLKTINLLIIKNMMTILLNFFILMI